MGRRVRVALTLTALHGASKQGALFLLHFKFPNDLSSLCPDSPTLAGTESCTGQIRHPEQNSSDPLLSRRGNTSARPQVTRQDGHPFQRTLAARSAAGGTTRSGPVQKPAPHVRSSASVERRSWRLLVAPIEHPPPAVPLRCRREVEPPPLPPFPAANHVEWSTHVRTQPGRTADEGRAKGWPAAGPNHRSQSLCRSSQPGGVGLDGPINHPMITKTMKRQCIPVACFR